MSNKMNWAKLMIGSQIVVGDIKCLLIAVDNSDIYFSLDVPSNHTIDMQGNNLEIKLNQENKEI